MDTIVDYRVVLTTLAELLRGKNLPTKIPQMRKFVFGSNNGVKLNFFKTDASGKAKQMPRVHSLHVSLCVLQTNLHRHQLLTPALAKIGLCAM